MNNIQKKDEELFDKIAEKYYLKDITKVSAIPRKNQLMQAVKPALNKNKNLGKILEIGCGNGFPAKYLENYYDEYIGIDHSEKMINIATQLHSKLENVKFLNEKVEELTHKLGNEKFDTILSVGVLHHLENPIQALKELKLLAKPNASFIAIEPNSRNIIIQILRWFRKKIDKNYSKDQKFFLAKEIKNILNDSNITNIKIEYEGFLSTPFSQVILKPVIIFTYLSRLSVMIDNLISFLPSFLKSLSWNLLIYSNFKNKE